MPSGPSDTTAMPIGSSAFEEERLARCVITDSEDDVVKHKLS
jgi:hypothetical protein